MKRNTKRFFGVCAVVLMVIIGVLWLRPDTKPAVASDVSYTNIALGNTTIHADLATTDEAREQGLSGRPGLDDTQGMLFVFQNDMPHAFWMKDMLFSIDMLWLTADKHVVYIVPNASPDSYPGTFLSKDPARFVLEVPAGWAARHGVTVGSIAAWK